VQKLSLIPTKTAENRVKKQLVEALLYENLIPFEEDNGTFHLLGKSRTYRFRGKRMAFDRVRLDEERIEATLEELVEACIADGEAKRRLVVELTQTITLCEWNEAHLFHPMSRRDSSYEELESEIIEGHPYHPCFKSRMGFSIQDHEQFGPEAKRSFPLIWTAVKRNKVRISIPGDEEAFWRKELGSLMWEYLLQQLHSMGESFDTYTFLPIHPYQWKSIQEHLENSINAKEILLLRVKGDYYRATQSVRTLWNECNPEKANMKLSMNMVNTSSKRTLQSHAVCAAANISDWLENVIQNYFYLKNEAALVILKEYAGITFESSEQELEGQLGAIWRESIRVYMNKGEGAVPFIALAMIEQDGRTFIDDWLTKYGIENWLNQFIQVSVVPVWHLFIAHGIAIEAHAQNMILLHKNGWPTKVVLRDFHDSLEYVEEFLVNKDFVPNFENIHPAFKDAPPDQYYWMSSVEALRELVMDTLFVFHLTELSALLEKQYGYKEEKFWHAVDTALSFHLDKFPELIHRHKQVEINKPFIYAESLLKKKLSKKSEGEFRHIVNNTLGQKENYR